MLSKDKYCIIFGKIIVIQKPKVCVLKSYYYLIENLSLINITKNVEKFVGHVYRLAKYHLFYTTRIKVKKNTPKSTKKMINSKCAPKQRKWKNTITWYQSHYKTPKIHWYFNKHTRNWILFCISILLHFLVKGNPLYNCASMSPGIMQLKRMLKDLI